MISRKTLLKGGLSALALATASLSGAAPSRPARAMARPSGDPAKSPTGKRPNILFIVTDQERSWQHLPPTLDLPRRRAFAATATDFSAYHGNVVACGPSRSVIYTGQHIQKTGVFDNPGDIPGRNDLDPNATPTIGAMLAQEGYATGYIGKWHLSTLPTGSPDSLRDALQPYGFDTFIPATEQGDTDGGAQAGHLMDAKIAAHAVDWMTTAAKQTEDTDQPWFLAVNLINPHDIRLFDATGHQADNLHPHFGSELGHAPDTPLYNTDLGYDLPASFHQAQRAVPAHRLYTEDEAYFFGEIPLEDEAAWRRYQNYYFNCLRDVDRQIGTLLDGLDATGLSEDTIVVFTSDHGEMAGAHGLKGKGPFLYKENFHLPLLIRHPDLPAGGASDALACSLDLAPTLLAMAGVDTATRQDRHPDLRGRNLLDPGTPRDALLFMSDIVHCCNPTKKAHIIDTLYARDRGEETSPFTFPDDFVDFSNRSFLRGIYDGQYKFGRYFAPNEHHTPRDWNDLARHNDLELYDTAADPDEMVNLAADPAYRDVMLALNARLNRLLAAEAGADTADFMQGMRNWVLKT